MIDVALLDRVIWADNHDDMRPYALIDGDWCPTLYGRLLESSLEWCSLYQGATAAQHLHDAPYIIALRPGDGLVTWLLEEGYGQGWGIYFKASARMLRASFQDVNFQRLAEMRQHGHFIASPEIELSDPPSLLLLLRRHFRRFTEVVNEENGRPLQFRFYDPAVLNFWLTECSPDERVAFFGPVQEFFTEKGGDIHRLTLVSHGNNSANLQLTNMGDEA